MSSCVGRPSVSICAPASSPATASRTTNPPVRPSLWKQKSTSGNMTPGIGCTLRQEPREQRFLAHGYAAARDRCRESPPTAADFSSAAIAQDPSPAEHI